MCRFHFMLIYINSIAESLKSVKADSNRKQNIYVTQSNLIPKVSNKDTKFSEKKLKYLNMHNTNKFNVILAAHIHR